MLLKKASGLKVAYDFSPRILETIPSFRHVHLDSNGFYWAFLLTEIFPFQGLRWPSKKTRS